MYIVGVAFGELSLRILVLSSTKGNSLQDLVSGHERLSRGLSNSV